MAANRFLSGAWHLVTALGNNVRDLVDLQEEMYDTSGTDGQAVQESFDAARTRDDRRKGIKNIPDAVFMYKMLYDIIATTHIDIDDTLAWAESRSIRMADRAHSTNYNNHTFSELVKNAITYVIEHGMIGLENPPVIIFPGVNDKTATFKNTKGGTTFVVNKDDDGQYIFVCRSPMEQSYTINISDPSSPVSDSRNSWLVVIDEMGKNVEVKEKTSNVTYAPRITINVQSRPKNSSLAPRRVGDTTTFIVPWEELHKPSNPNAVRMEIVPWDRGDGRPVQKSADAFYTALEEVVRGLTTGIDDVSLSRTINGVRGNYPKYPETRDSVETIVAEMVYVARTFSKTKAIAETVAPAISANRAEIVNRVMQRL